MNVAAPLLARALSQARAEWLSGDPSAWSRYADCLARLERHLCAAPAPRAPEATPRRPQPDRLRPPRGRA
jgi:hypothetical protein